ncbi:MAG: hypothetical protein K2O30_02880 [Duncaniella sp.]|nr:hypothetical protein [Duncaniella sp.]
MEQIGNSKRNWNKTCLINVNLLMAVCLLLFASISSSAQNLDETHVTCPLTGKSEESLMSHNIFGELFGPSFGVGIGFDSRFKNGTPFGYRVGISYTDGSFDDIQRLRDLYFNGVCVPLEINAIFGKRKSKFEIGVGATPSILRRVYTRWYWNDDVAPGYMTTNSVTTRGTKLNILGTLNIGYRYQRERGFFLRAGLTIYVGDLKCSPIDGVFVLPNISLGYTLKY